jgi:hypothetical protein
MNRNWTIIAGFLSLVLLGTILIKLTDVPGGLILPGIFLGLMVVGVILIVCAVLALLIRIFAKKPSFLLLYSILTSICFLFFHYTLYAPVLKITVPRNYSGPVALVLSNVEENILNLDTNGIGYITEWTFNHTYKRPIVVDSEGNDIGDRCVGFNPSTFWAISESSSSMHKRTIHSLCFEIIHSTKRGQKQYITFNSDMVDTSKLLK